MSRQKQSKLWIYLGNLSIKQKMLLTLVSILFVFYASVFFIYQYMLKDLQNFVVESNARIITFIENDIQSRLNLIEKAANTLIVNEEIQRYIAPDSSKKDKELLVTLMTRNLYKHLSVTTIPNVDSVMVVLENGDYVFSHLSKTLTANESKSLAQFILDQYNITFEKSFLVPPEELYEKTGCLIYVVPLSGHVAGERQSFLAMSISEHILSNILAKYYSKDRIISVSDQSGHVIWNTEPLYQPANGKTSILDQKVNAKIFKTTQGKYIEMQTDIELIDWTVILQIPVAQIQSNLKPYHTVFWVSLIFSTTLATTFYLVLSQIIGGRISEMSYVINDIRKGNLDSRFPVNYQDEISVIGSEFNKMVDQIQHLRIHSMNMRLQQKEAELKALQSQINPHFLYNSLDSIRMLAVINDDESVAEQIKILSDLTRYTIKPGSLNSRVTFAEEVKHVKKYLQLQHLRFGDRCHTKINVDKRLLSLKTIKLTLQPIVENAFIHGIYSLEEGGEIEISGSIDYEKGIVLFRVSDNGPGISSDKLVELRNLLNTDSEQLREESSIGLVNIHDRIRLSFGDKYGLTVESNSGTGTVVSIYYPILGEE